MQKTTFTRYSLLLAGLFLLAGWTLTMTLDRYTFQPESALWIEGTSSVHDWTCTVERVTGSLEKETASAGLIPVPRAEVAVPVEAIECNNGTMNKKTRKALNADAHPTIRYVLDEATALPGAADGSFDLKTTGRLTIASVDQPVEMTVAGERLADGRFRFTGQTPLLMTDFGVEPPTALLGTLKTGDRVVVHFDVVAALDPASVAGSPADQ